MTRIVQDYNEKYYCREKEPVTYSGTFKMIDENTFKIELDPIYNYSLIPPPDFNGTYTFIDNRIIRSYTRYHPISYNKERQAYNSEKIEVNEIFELEQLR